MQSRDTRRPAARPARPAARARAGGSRYGSGGTCASDRHRVHRGPGVRAPSSRARPVTLSSQVSRISARLARNPRRAGGLLLAVGTLLAVLGMSSSSSLDHAGVQTQTHAQSVAATDTPSGRAPSGPDYLPITVPRSQRAAATLSPAYPVSPDRLVGPRPAAPMGFSVPVHLDVPRAGINAEVAPVGLATRAAPGVLPLKQPRVAAWYDLGPAPGQLGIAVLDAHVGARASRSLRPGDTVEVARADHSLAIFTVDAAERVPNRRGAASSRGAVPSGAVPFPALNLVTCAGSLDTWRHGCLDHTVVHAHLTGFRAPASGP